MQAGVFPMTPVMHDDGRMAQTAPGPDRQWTLLTNHGRVLLLIAQQPELRLRDLADAAGITERSTQMIVSDLERAGYIDKERVGRRNAYSVNRTAPFRHPAESGHVVGELIDLFATPADSAPAAGTRRP